MVLSLKKHRDNFTFIIIIIIIIIYWADDIRPFYKLPVVTEPENSSLSIQTATASATLQAISSRCFNDLSVCVQSVFFPRGNRICTTP
jgi:hypothetical protein